jgi:integrase/recombinase XerC/integrase/recombinase XerD
MELLSLQKQVLINYTCELLNNFINAQDVNKKSKETYQGALKQFFRYIEKNNLININRQNILDYKNHLKSCDYSCYTISCYITAIRKFFNWTASVGLHPNVAENIKGAKQPRGFRKEVFTTQQIRSILGSIDCSTLRGKRDYALINLMLRTGLRTIEIVRADVGDLKQKGTEAMLYIQGKGRSSKDEVVVLTPEALQPLMAYLSVRDTTDKSPLFASLSDRNYGACLTACSISRIVKTRLRFVSLNSDKLTAHSCRHTAVTLALLGGATLQETQQMARHSSINTTLIYSHNLDRVNNAAERHISF